MGTRQCSIYSGACHPCLVTELIPLNDVFLCDRSYVQLFSRTSNKVVITSRKQMNQYGMHYNIVRCITILTRVTILAGSTYFHLASARIHIQ